MQAFKLPAKVRDELCTAFNQDKEWRKLALGLRLDRYE